MLPKITPKQILEFRLALKLEIKVKTMKLSQTQIFYSNIYTNICQVNKLIKFATIINK